MTVPLVGIGSLDDPLAALHREQYRSLVRLATLLLGDVESGEEVVQDAFVRVQLRWGGLRDLDRASAYLRSAVLNGARSLLRKRKVRDRHALRRGVETLAPLAEAGAMVDVEHQRVVVAMRRLPARQREALALRYYFELSEPEIAAAMGVSSGSVKTHIHRALASLGELLEEGRR